VAIERSRLAIAGLLALGAAAGCDPPAPGADGGRLVPVSVAEVVKRDVPIYLDGLGSVLAFNTITLHTQVDGELLEVRFREGQEVKRGDVLALVDARSFEAQLHQAEGALARDLALLRDSKLNLTRNLNLLRRRLVGQETVDDQEALVGQYLGAARIDRAQMAIAKLNIEYARVTSPVHGVAGIRLVDPGNIVHTTDANGIVILTQLEPIAVIFTLPQDDLPEVAKAMRRGPLDVAFYNRDGQALLGRGRVAVIDNQINQTTATIRLKAIAPNPDRMLWPNQFVKAHLHLLTLVGAIVVPQQAVQRGPQGTFVYVVAAGDTVAARPVELERTQGELAIVRAGLVPGERVVLDEQNQLAPGARVTIRAEPRDLGAPDGGHGDGGDGGAGAVWGEHASGGRP
jgi:membrane fusion protein, multidrug efflux system